ncbi:MFS transporter [bacterium]|nr:MFS transporter [bacterium]QQR56627.1 MAG: MFS transporter [Candidatus Melainabacteria bacterium]
MIQETKEQAKPKKTALILIFFTVFIDLVGFGLIIPALPTYAQRLHASEFTVGMLIASYSLMQFFFTPIWGRLSDKLGRRPMLLFSLAASALGYLIWGFADSLWMLFLSRIVAGFGNANIAVAQAYISDVTSLEDRAKGMGLVGAAFGLGFVIGPAIGCGLSAMGMGLSALGFVAFAFSLLDLILTAALLPEPQKRSNAGNERFGISPKFFFDVLLNAKLKVSLAIFFISTFAFANMEATLILLTNKIFKFNDVQNMLMFLYIGILMVFVQGGLIHRLNKKYGEKKLIIIGTALIAVGLVFTPISQNPVVLYLALAVLALGSGINTPANQSMLSKLAPSDTAGGVLGVGQSLSTLGRIAGPIVGCYVFETMGSQSPYMIGAAAMVIAFALGFMLPEPSQEAA